LRKEWMRDSSSFSCEHGRDQRLRGDQSWIITPIKK
jgi:hypothetical protein